MKLITQFDVKIATVTPDADDDGYLIINALAGEDGDGARVRFTIYRHDVAKLFKADRLVLKILSASEDE